MTGAVRVILHQTVFFDAPMRDYPISALYYYYQRPPPKDMLDPGLPAESPSSATLEVCRKACQPE